MPQQLQNISDEQLSSYSFITTVYLGTELTDLSRCIDSMKAQTVRPDKIVVVADGELRQDVLSYLQRIEDDQLEVIFLDSNVGPGAAAQVAIDECKTELIARLDSDDISNRRRIEKQVETYRAHRELGSVGSFVIERNSENGCKSMVDLPIDFGSIKEFAKIRCPLRQSTLLLRKSAVDLVGGYSSLRFAEDWDLYNRFIQFNVPCMNIPEYLVEMRVDSDFYARRGGIDKLSKLISFKIEMLVKRQTDVFSFLISSAASIVTCLIPNKLRIFFYTHFLRR